MSIRDRDYMKWRSDAEAPANELSQPPAAPEKFNLFAGLPVEDLKAESTKAPPSPGVTGSPVAESQEVEKDSGVKGGLFLLFGIVLAILVALVVAYGL